MDIVKTDLSVKILTEVKNINIPVGAIFLSDKLNIPQASLGRQLSELDKLGLLKKVSNKGRQITEKGEAWLEDYHDRENKQKTSQKLISLVEELSKERLLEILDIRKRLECYSVALACENATEEDIEKLENALLDHRYAVNHGETGSAEDLTIHLLIAKISKNVTLYQMIELLLKRKHAYDMFSAVADNITKPHIQQHTDLVMNIKARNVESAQETLLEHLDQVIADVQKYYQE